MNNTRIAPILLIAFLTLPLVSLANVAGTDLQNFNPVMNGLDFVTVHSTRPLKPGQINVGGFGTYVTNSLPYSTTSSTSNSQSFGDPNDQILYSNLHLAIGLMQGWDIGISSGFTMSQSLQQDNFLFSYGNQGLNEIRVASKLRFYQDDLVAMALVGGVDFEQIKDNPFMGDNAAPTVNGEGVVDVRLTPELLWAVNVGFRLRQPGGNIPNLGVTALSHQITYSSALSYQTDEWGSAVIAEIFGSALLEPLVQPTDRDMSNLEVLLGYRWMGLEEVDIHGGIGSSFYYGLGSPDMRAYLGVNWRLNFLSEG